MTRLSQFAYLSSSSGPNILYLEHKADGTTVCACPWARLLLSFSVEDNWKPSEDREISICLRAYFWCGIFFLTFCTQKLCLHNLMLLPQKSLHLFCSLLFITSEQNEFSPDSIKALFSILVKSNVVNCSFSQTWLLEKQANNQTNQHFNLIGKKSKHKKNNVRASQHRASFLFFQNSLSYPIGISGVQSLLVRYKIQALENIVLHFYNNYIWDVICSKSLLKIVTLLLLGKTNT